jgi:Uma2 family endonuclease
MAWQIAPESSVILYDISWETYEHLLADHISRSVPHFTYDQGTLEIARPGIERVQIAHALERVFDSVAELFESDWVPVGSMTYHRKSAARGFEPDSSYYIRDAERIRGVKQIDAEIDPPPDLIIVVDVTGDAMNKLPTYAALDVPEVWQHVPEHVSIYLLRDGVYEESTASAAVPILTREVLTRFVEQDRVLSSLAWREMVREWAEQQAWAERAGM